MGGLKELIAVLCLTLPVFWIARGSACEFAIDGADFNRRRNLWIAITVLAFIANNFWFYLVGAGVIIAFGATREPNRMAMFLALMMAIPAYGKSIAGFGGIQEIMNLNQLRLLSIVVLLPAYLVVRRGPGVLPFGKTNSDKCLLAYLALQLILQFPIVSGTSLTRNTIYLFVDVFLPYYVASRGLRNIKDYRDILMTLFITVLAISPIAVFEYFRHWQLYANLSGYLGTSADSLGNYMVRGGGVRAVVTGQHPIILGYMATVALGAFVFAQRFVRNRLISALGLSLLIATLIASGSRGPWVGGAAVLAVVLMTGEDRMKRTTQLTIFAIPALFALSFTEFGERLFDALPFIGTADADSVDYRRLMFETSLLVIRQNLWFGAFDYLANPAMQNLITGDGIIDIVNTFVGVTLTYGIVGFGLFCGVFLFATRDAYNTLKRAEKASDTALLGRALLAMMAGAMVTIVTASSVGLIPLLYWIIAGLCVGYGQLAGALSPTQAFTRHEAQGGLARV